MTNDKYIANCSYYCKIVDVGKWEKELSSHIDSKNIKKEHACIMNSKSCHFYAVSYVEYFNRVLHYAQINFLVRFCNVSKKLVETRCYTSEILQGAEAVRLSKLIQIFTEGASVNLKFLKNDE